MRPTDTIAMAALMHDIGKFYQRTGAEADEGNMHLYCKRNSEGFLTHHHALFTAQAIDRISGNQGWLRPFIEHSIFEGDDSFINAASMHHKPETRLQWIVAIADRVSSGFERERFEEGYNAKTESPDYLRARLIPVFETLTENSSKSYDYRYPLRPFDELFGPVTEREAVPENKESAKNEYRRLYDEFEEALETIKESENGERILEAFDSAWLRYTFAIPSATAMGTKPTVSLYDHSRSTAAFAAALWQYHQNDDEADLNSDRAWEEKKFLLISGDFFGIQKFIFSGSEENSRHVAKQLRGKSAAVSLMTELAALKVIEALGLSRISMVQNIAGKFLIVAANTEKNRKTLEEVRKEIDAWFMRQSYARAGIIFATVTASCSDFTQHKLATLMKELAGENELAKSRKFDLLHQENPIFTGYLEEMAGTTPCNVCSIHPAKEEGECDMCGFFTHFGQKLASAEKRHLYIYRHRGGFDLFGYEVDFKFDESRDLISKWDIALPDDTEKRFEGLPIRTLKAYIPTDENGKPLEFSRLAELGEGQSAISAFKADIDDLGALFIEKLPKKDYSFARYNMTARLIDHFFSVETAHLLATKFPLIYTIFAGGDDLFVVGPWNEVQSFAIELKQRFDKYFITQKSCMSFSAGVVMVHDKTPVNFMAHKSEEALESMKRSGKNGVHIFGNDVTYVDFIDLMELADKFSHYRKRFGLSTGFIYVLPEYARMKEEISRNPENAIWRSKLRYSGYRNVVEKNKKEKEEALRFIETIARNIEIYGKEFEVAVFTHLYKERNNA